MAKNNKRGKKEESDSGGAPRWMTTFSDLMSLLLTFFILIVSFSSIELIKFQKAMGSLQGALGILPQQQSVIFQKEPIIPQLAEHQRRRVQKVAGEFRKMIKKKGLDQQVKLETTDRGVVIRINSPILFDLGKARLKPQAFPILDKIVDLTKDWPNSIQIEGHTDDLPIHTAQFPSNWDLSTARAMSVLRYFLHKGLISPQRLSAAGYGEYHPLVPNSSPANRAKNRRVEIYVQYDQKNQKFREAIF